MVSYFALINNDSIVTDVIVTPFFDNETAGQQYIADLDISGTWIQTFMNGDRGKYAGIGDIYDAELDEFVTPESETPE